MSTELLPTSGAELVPADMYPDLEPDETKPADQNPALVYVASLQSGSQRTMREALDLIARALTGGRCDALTMPWAQLRFQHTAAIRARLADGYAPATANKMLSALRGTLEAALDLGQMSGDDYQHAIKVKGVAGSAEEPAGRALAPGEITGLLQACAEDHSPAGYRDGAIIALMYACGPRRAEVVGLDLADFEPIPDGDGEREGKLTIRHGKRNKTRVTYANNGALEALLDWLSVRGDQPGPLFVAINKGGKLALGQRMTSQAIYNMLSKRAAEAKIKGFSPHDMRRTFISDLLDAGADIAIVARLVGHDNIQTTKRYDRRPERAKRKAVALLHVPYTRRRLEV